MTFRFKTKEDIVRQTNEALALEVIEMDYVSSMCLLAADLIEFPHLVNYVKSIYPPMFEENIDQFLAMNLEQLLEVQKGFLEHRELCIEELNKRGQKLNLTLLKGGIE